MQPAHAPRRIVIVGGGVSGVALAIHLLAHPGVHVAIVERREGLGRGPAYGTSDPAFRLNVLAGRMSLFPGRPDDFIAWARDHGARAEDYLPRRLFGEYVEARLAEAVRAHAHRVVFHRNEAVTASATAVTLAGATTLECDAVVLATGNQRPAAPAAFAPDLLASPRVVGDPWADHALADIDRDERLLLVGTGLTTLDVLRALHNHGHRGRVVATSRHGLLPRPHLAADDPRSRPVALDPAMLPHTLAALCRHLRAEVRRAAADGTAWQSVIDGLRPHTTAVWRSLPLSERRRFMARVRPYWDVLRHRAAPDQLAAVATWQTTGWLELLAGHITSVRETTDLELEIQPRHGPPRHHRCDRVILCTGPQTDVHRWDSPLYRHLLATGDLVGDPLGLGVVTDDIGRARDHHGHSSAWLYTIGALRRPHLWETTAVPDIVRQAVTLANTLAAP